MGIAKTLREVIFTSAELVGLGRRLLAVVLGLHHGVGDIPRASPSPSPVARRPSPVATTLVGLRSARSSSARFVDLCTVHGRLFGRHLARALIRSKESMGARPTSDAAGPCATPIRPRGGVSKSARPASTSSASAAASEPRPSPLQNRVTPWGDLVAVPRRYPPSTAAFGNRGVLHDATREVTRPFKVTAWLACKFHVTRERAVQRDDNRAFNGRKRVVMAPGRYTELFFLDEHTALAAGHRPCACCRREDYTRFVDAWTKAHGIFFWGEGVYSAHLLNKASSHSPFAFISPSPPPLQLHHHVYAY